MEVRIVDLANWAHRTSPKFAAVVKYQFPQGFWQDDRSFSFKFVTRWNRYRSLLFCTCRIFSAFFLISLILFNFFKCRNYIQFNSVQFNPNEQMNVRSIVYYTEQTTWLLRGAMGGISIILVKNHFFILLNKFNLNTVISDSLKYQTSITVVQSFIKTYVNLCAI